MLFQLGFRCEHLIQRLNSTSELVKRSEIVCELEAVAAEVSCLKNINATREMVVVTVFFSFIAVQYS